MKDTKDALGRTISRRRFLATSAFAGMSVAGSSSLLAACGGDSGGPGGGSDGGGQGGTVTWGSWANPGEAERFRAYNKMYEENTGVDITWQNVVGDYASKMLTQLSGGSAPDAFYVGDTLISKAIESNVLLPLGDHPPAKAVYDATYPGLRKWAESADGKIYGIDVDCNPKVFWFNKKILTAAGVDQDPAVAYEAGSWTMATLTDMLTKIKTNTDVRGMAFESGWGDLMSWITTFGGTVFDDNGKAVFDTDPKAQMVIEWLFEQMRNGNITYAGSLPKGQGVDALFYSGQLATIQYGRWILPNLKKLKSTIEYDIAPMPSPTGGEVMPVAVFTACMSINAAAADKDAALKFVADYCGLEGQKFRLSGGGNAVPSIPGLNEIVTEGNDPPHGQYFTDVAAAGYAVPLPLIRDAKKAADFPLRNDVLLKNLEKQTPKRYSQTLVKLLNA